MLFFDSEIGQATKLLQSAGAFEMLDDALAETQEDEATSTDDAEAVGSD